MTIPRGALPTFQVCVIAPVVGFIATTLFWPFTVAYIVLPSLLNTAWAGSGCFVPSIGSEMKVGALTLPSALTGNRSKPLICCIHKNLPSGSTSDPPGRCCRRRS